MFNNCYLTAPPHPVLPNTAMKPFYLLYLLFLLSAQRCTASDSSVLKIENHQPPLDVVKLQGKIRTGVERNLLLSFMKLFSQLSNHTNEARMELHTTSGSGGGGKGLKGGGGSASAIAHRPPSLRSSGSHVVPVLCSHLLISALSWMCAGSPLFSTF